MLGLNVFGALDRGDDTDHSLGRGGKLLQVIADDLDCDVGSHARDQLVETHLDRLDELIARSRHIALDHLVHLLDQFGLGLARVGPFVPRLHDDEGVGDARWHRIGRDIGGADLGEHFGYFGKLLDPVLERGLHLHRLAEAGPRDSKRMERNIALVEIGNEFGPQPGRGETAQGDQSECADHYRFARSKRPVDQRSIAPFGRRHDPAFLFLDSTGDEGGDCRRDQGQRQDRRRGQRQHDGDCHRVEGLTLDPCERKDRQVDDGDDGDSEQARPHHFRRCAGGQIEPLLSVQQSP